MRTGIGRGMCKSGGMGFDGYTKMGYYPVRKYTNDFGGYIPFAISRTNCGVT